MAMEAMNYIKEMRDWCCECVWADVDADEILDMPDDKILRAINRHYVGGVAQFIVDAQPVNA